MAQSYDLEATVLWITWLLEPVFLTEGKYNLCTIQLWGSIRIGVNSNQRVISKRWFVLRWSNGTGQERAKQRQHGTHAGPSLKARPQEMM